MRGALAAPFYSTYITMASWKYFGLAEPEWMALGLNAVPGVWWVSKVDGKIGKRRNDRIEEGRHLKRQLIGTLHMQMTQASLGKQMKSAKRKNFFP